MNCGTMTKCETPASTVEQARAGQTYVPRVDIVEQGDEMLIFADIPGVTAQNVDIDFDKGALTITGRVPQRRNGHTREVFSEYGVGDFRRTFQVGDGFDASQFHAEISHGVLTLHLPKAQSLRARKIAVKGA
ncbi:MAG: Hsp20/alpha crystallin family protein [Phycisphaerales bacterium]|nr:Hsp20/alpha crystallin family protein [Phycisphaerales bacterium]